jgi:hypothetical protein
MKKIFSLILILILYTGFFTGCKKDKGEPPVLPPQGSMMIDFDNFAAIKKSAGFKGTDISTWEFAASVADIWNLLITNTLIVPIASFKQAVDQDPVFVSDKLWQWSYNASVGGVTYKARLTGQIGDVNVTWKMYITKEGTGAFPEFLWFEGTSKLDGTGGQWTLYQSPSATGAFLQIDWTKSGSSIATIQYTFIKNGDAFKTSSILYGLRTGTYDAYYTVHYFNNVKFSDVDVEWNTTSANGRVRSSDYLDGSWFCWNSNKINILCI